MEYRQLASPADAFCDIAESMFYLSDFRMSTEVERHPYGDTLRVYITGVDPEGQRIDVDRYRATEVDECYVIDFSEELPVDGVA